MLVCRLWFFSPLLFINRLMADPKLAPHLYKQRHRTYNDDQSFWGSPAFQHLNSALGGRLTQTDSPFKTLVFGIGIDGVQLLNWGSRTATVVGLKCEDLPPSLAFKNSATFPVMIIEGKQEPHVMNHALQLVIDFFKKHRGAKACFCG